MTTITQPRPSISTTTSTRTSLDTTTSASASAANASPLPSRSPSRGPDLASPSATTLPLAGLTATSLPSAGLQPPTNPAASRRNRAALRDYYGLRKSTSNADIKGIVESEADIRAEGARSELDTPGFAADSYVAGLLADEDLDSLLRAESELVNEIKFLTSERAALVYDNYSKLIAATDTIKRMRTNMAPLTPATSTLAPAVAHIADTAVQLALKAQGGPTQGRPNAVDWELEAVRRAADRGTVRWVLDTPRRILELGAEKADWDRVRGTLESWSGVDGADKLREECERALREAEA